MRLISRLVATDAALLLCILHTSIMLCRDRSGWWQCSLPEFIDQPIIGCESHCALHQMPLPCCSTCFSFRYGNQGSWVDPFAPHRGGGRSAFGVLPWGGCGLTNGDGKVLWPQDQVTSYATGNPDFPGSCGRCYEVRCFPGPVLGWDNKTVDFRNAYFPFWWYANVTDDMGRSFPGEPSQSLTACLPVFHDHKFR